MYARQATTSSIPGPSINGRQFRGTTTEQAQESAVYSSERAASTSSHGMMPALRALRGHNVDNLQWKQQSWERRPNLITRLRLPRAIGLVMRDSERSIVMEGSRSHRVSYEADEPTAPSSHESNRLTSALLRGECRSTSSCVLSALVWINKVLTHIDRTARLHRCFQRPFR